MKVSRPTPYFSRTKTAPDGSVIYFDSQEDADRFDAGHGIADDRSDEAGRVMRTDSGTRTLDASKIDARERMIKRHAEMSKMPAVDTNERADDGADDAGLDARERFLKRIGATCQK